MRLRQISSATASVMLAQPSPVAASGSTSQAERPGPVGFRVGVNAKPAGAVSTASTAAPTRLRLCNFQPLFPRLRGGGTPFTTSLKKSCSAGQRPAIPRRRRHKRAQRYQHPGLKASA
jgi:hypothetical protein